MSQDDDGGWFATTYERKYYRKDNVFIKRSLRPSEFRCGYAGLHVPRAGMERLKNEAASMRYVRAHTNVPVPRLLCDFEEDGAYYLIMEAVDGVSMSNLTEEEKSVVKEELKLHLDTLHAETSTCLGGPGGLVIPPYRVTLHTANDSWTPHLVHDEELVFCHNDLSQPNVIVDPATLQIRAILDWEYAGFYPPYFEAAFYERLGPSCAMEGELDDSENLLKYMITSEANWADSFILFDGPE